MAAPKQTTTIGTWSRTVLRGTRNSCGRSTGANELSSDNDSHLFTLNGRGRLVHSHLHRDDCHQVYKNRPTDAAQARCQGTTFRCWPGIPGNQHKQRWNYPGRWVVVEKQSSKG